MSNVLVTGGEGFIGTHLVMELISLGHNVLVLDDGSGVSPESFREPLFNACNIQILRADVGHLSEMALNAIEAFETDVLYHLAATAREGASAYDPANTTWRNLYGYTNVLEKVIQRCALKHVVLASTMAVYGHQPPPFYEGAIPTPADVYGFNKACMEGVTKNLAEFHDFTWTIVRPHNVYGPGQRLDDPYRNVVGIFMNRAMRDEPLYVYGNCQRAFSYVSDSVEFMATLVDRVTFAGGTYNVGGDEVMAVSTLARRILELFSESKSQLKQMKKRKGDVEVAYSDHALAREVGFRTVTNISDGLADMAVWAKQNGPEDWAYQTLPLENATMPEPWIDKK